MDQISEKTKGCLHYSLCGGCSSQHISYEMQCTEKQALIHELYAPFASKIEPLVECQDPWHYRNKMEFSFSQDKQKKMFLGLFGPRRRVVDIQTCTICPPWFIEALEQVRFFWKNSHLEAYYPPKNTGTLIHIAIRQGVYTNQTMVILTVAENDHGLTQKQAQQFVQALSHLNLTSIVLREKQMKAGVVTTYRQTVLSGEPYIEERLTIRGKMLCCRIKPESFFQPNTKQAEKLYSKAIELANLHSHDVVWDLYCGTGLIGMAASFEAKEVYGIEVCSDAVLDAQANLEKNSISNMRIIHSEVEKPHDLPDPDCIFIDPPRSGLTPKALQWLVSVKCKKIIYISCNPQTQKKDIQLLLEQGYIIEKIAPFDQFPHTRHLENIVALRTLV